MRVEWDGYEVYDPGVKGPLNTVSRSEARQAFRRLMEAKPRRIDLLRQLLAANGILLGDSDVSIQVLNDWFRANVEEDPKNPGRLLPDWYSVVNDIALFLGDVMIRRHPHLRWEFFTWGTKNAAYQRHVIMGFRTEDPKHRTNLDIDMAAAIYGQRIIGGQEVAPDAFCQWLRTVDRRA